MKQFAASVQNTSSKGVTWRVNGITGGSGKYGTISTTGAYVAPNQVPSPSIVNVTAVSQADPTKSATASVQIIRR